MHPDVTSVRFSMDEKRLNTSWLAILLGALTAFGPLAIDMYLPAFPQITRDLNAGEGAIQFTLAAFLIGSGVSQVLYGPLTDRLGRRGPLLVGCALFVVGALACSMARSVKMLVLARVVQAFGAGGGVVIARAIVRDLFEGRDSAHFFSQLMVVMGVAPIVAPWIGGQVLALGNWRLIFIALAAFGGLCFLLSAFTLRETLPVERRTGRGTMQVVKTFGSLLRHRVFVGYTVVAGLCSGVLFAYIAGAPVVYIELHHVSPQHFGLFFGANAVGLIGAAQLNRLLLRTHTIEGVLRATLFGILISTLALAVVGATGWGGLPALATLLFLCMACIGLAGPNLMTAALAPFKTSAGSASALLGLAQYAFGGIAGALVGMLHNHTAVPMTAIVAACGVSSFVALWLVPKPAEAI